jgi:hypothetical protein
MISAIIKIELFLFLILTVFIEAILSKKIHELVHFDEPLIVKVMLFIFLFSPLVHEVPLTQGYWLILILIHLLRQLLFSINFHTQQFVNHIDRKPNLYEAIDTQDMFIYNQFFSLI